MPRSARRSVGPAVSDLPQRRPTTAGLLRIHLQRPQQFDPIALPERLAALHASAENRQRQRRWVEPERLDEVAATDSLRSGCARVERDFDARRPTVDGVADLDFHRPPAAAASGGTASPLCATTSSARLTKLSTIVVAIWWNTGPTSPLNRKLLKS